MKVITFSRFYQANHPKKGQPTYFVEKIMKGFNEEKYESEINFVRKTTDLGIQEWYDLAPKFHTIRAGERWKVGDKFSPRVWSGKPYRSKQIIIAPDIEIKKIWKFECKENGVFYLDGKPIDITSCDLPANDGLETDDFLEWFPDGKIFSGQVLCWNSLIKY